MRLANTWRSTGTRGCRFAAKQAIVFRFDRAQIHAHSRHAADAVGQQHQRLFTVNALARLGAFDRPGRRHNLAQVRQVGNRKWFRAARIQVRPGCQKTNLRLHRFVLRRVTFQRKLCVTHGLSRRKTGHVALPFAAMDWTCCAGSGPARLQRRAKWRGILQQQPMTGWHRHDSTAIGQRPNHHVRVMSPAPASRCLATLQASPRTFVTSPTEQAARKSTGCNRPPARGPASQTREFVRSAIPAPTQSKAQAAWARAAAIFLCRSNPAVWAGGKAITRSRLQREFHASSASAFILGGARPVNSNCNSPKPFSAVGVHQN